MYSGTQGGDDLLGRQRVDVPDLPGNGHGVAVNDVEVLLAEQQQALAGVQTLHSGTAVHVLNLQEWMITDSGLKKRLQRKDTLSLDKQCSGKTSVKER